MESFIAHLYLVCKLAFLMAVGVILRKTKVLSSQGMQVVTDLVIQLILPCSILSSFLSNTTIARLEQAAWIFLLSLGIQLFSYGVGCIAYRFCSPEHRSIMQYGTICSNSGILGTPIVEGIWGMEGTLLSSIFLIPTRVVMWTLGLAVFTGNRTRFSIKKTLSHPCVAAVCIGLFLMLTNCPVPSLLTDCIHTISQCNTALSMILVGNIAANIPVRLLFHQDTLWFCTVRLFLLPLTVLLFCKAFHPAALVQNISVILTAMPAGATTSILVFKYHGDTSFASACTAESTVLSLAALPIWCAILL